MEVGRGRMFSEVKVALTLEGVTDRWRGIRGAARLKRGVGLLRWSTAGWFRLRFLDSRRYLLKITHWTYYCNLEMSIHAAIRCGSFSCMEDQFCSKLLDLHIFTENSKENWPSWARGTSRF
jgi:hypothetical protein